MMKLSNVEMSAIKNENGKVSYRVAGHADIAEQNLMVQALEESHERFRFMADAMPQIVWTSRPDGNLDYYNQRWYDYTGMTFEQTRDWGWQPVLHPNDLQNCIDRWTHAYTTGENYEVEYRFKRAADGVYRWHLGRALPMRNQAGEITMWVGTCTDIDDYKRVEAELRTAREELEERVAQRTIELARANAFLQEQIAERKRAEEIFQDSRDYLDRIINAVADPIFVKDRQHCWALLNDAMCRIMGSDREELIGKSDYDFFPKSEADVFREKDETVFTTGEENVNEEQFTASSGTTHTILTRKRLHIDNNGEQFIVGVIRDITERKRIESELEVARDVALESVRLKSEFLANMSHEIRTPMNGVIGMTGLLLDTDLSPRQLDYTETIQSSADALLTIIDDILDFSKIEAGQLRFEKIDFDLREAVEAPVEILAERAQAKALELASLVYKNVPTALRGDPGRLRQVLTNLIGNAVKFTERGEVVINVSKEKESDGHVTLRFEIRDTGVGISEEARQRLFRPFIQADGSTTRKYGGTGLGLAISKQLVEQMGGEIGVESTPDVGSIFWFTARFEKQSKEAMSAQSAAIAAAAAVSLDGVRVLIVDDNATNRRIFLHQTASWGMIATEAESGVQALELLYAAAVEGKAYDIAILDLMMPNMDGFELASAIKADEAIAQVSLVLLPSFGRRGHGELARQAGIAAYLQKPVRQSQLYNCLMEVMAQSIGGDAVTSARLVTQYSLRQKKVKRNTSAATSASNIRILVAEDNLINRKVALSQLHNLGYTGDAVSNGREVIEALEKIHYDIILMDCQMPEMDGFEVTAEIRRTEDAATRTTIIAMTANAMQGDRERCLAAGMDDYLSKPVKSDVLRIKIEHWTKSANGSSPAKRKSESTVLNQHGDDTVVDLSVIASFREVHRPDEPDLATELIDLFLNDAQSQLNALRIAISNGDTAAILHITHLLKGSGGNMGARRMAAISEEIEAKASEKRVAETLFVKLESEFARVRHALEAERQETRA